MVYQDLGAAADNINILPTTGDPIVAGKLSGSGAVVTHDLQSFPRSKTCARTLTM